MYLPTRKQTEQLERLLEADGLIPAKNPTVPVATTASSNIQRKAFCAPVSAVKEVAILIDTPNASKTCKVYGEHVRPDYSAVMKLASQYGSVEESAFAFVNPGYKTSTAWASRLGYRVIRGTDHDVDHLIVSTAVELLAEGIKTLVIVSGDHRFCNVQNLCDRLNIQYIAIGVPCCTNRQLQKSGSFHALPVFQAHDRIAA